MVHLYEHVNGFEESASDSHILRLQRGTVLSWLCSMGEKTCNDDGFQIFDDWRNANQSLPNP